MFIVPRIVVVLVALIWMGGPSVADPILDAVPADAEIRIRNIILIRDH
jgi:hypothetical protein